MLSLLFLVLSLQTVFADVSLPGVIAERPTPQPNWHPREVPSQTPESCETSTVLFSDLNSANQNLYNTTRNWRAIDLSEILADGTAITKTWFVDASPLNTTAYLMSTPITLPSEGSIFFSFWHKYDTERGYDGAMVYYTSDGGQTWHDMDSFFIRNGYDFQMFTQRGALPAFSGNSGTSFNETIADISTLHGQTINFVFIMITDFSIPSVGWWVNNIRLWAATCPGQQPMPADTYPTSPPPATGNSNPHPGDSTGRPTTTSSNTAATNLAVAALIISILTSAFAIVMAIIGLSYFYTWRSREVSKVAIPMTNIGSLENPSPSPRS